MGPSKSLVKFAKKLFRNGPDPEEAAEKFVSSLIQNRDPEIALVWCKDRPNPNPFEILEPTPWQPSLVDRVPSTLRPGAQQLHKDGYYYCLDLSSVFAAAPLLELASLEDCTSWSVLDMCASPGGKSVLASVILNPNSITSNEVIKKRLGALDSNLRRCGVKNFELRSSDPSFFSENFPGLYDLVLVDAPCSGQSLMVKGKPAMGCFNPAVINLNCNRQRRIMANSLACVKEGGYLLYMTCTFSWEENEKVIEWVLSKFPGFSYVTIPQLSAFQSEFTELPCYRLWPQSGYGAGAFSCLLQKN